MDMETEKYSLEPFKKDFDVEPPLLGHNVSLALMHWPIYNRVRQTVVTNVTHLNIHDIARSCRSYGLKHYFIVNRTQEQLMFVRRVLDHWKVGLGQKLNPMRSTALHQVETEETLDEVLRKFYPKKKPYILGTTARKFENVPVVGFRQVREMIKKDRDQEVLILFGTGFGLHDDIINQCDGLIEPIRGSSEDDYRHLSVRSAVSICLDRLLGAW